MMSEQTLMTLARLVSQQLTPGDISSDEWPAIIAAATAHGLGPLLYRVLRQEDGEGVPSELRDRLRREQSAVVVQFMLLDQAQQEIQKEFDKNEISAIWLKGIHLARVYYPDPVLRPMGDLDVLVRYEDRQRARAAVAGLGYGGYERQHILSFSDTGAIPEHFSYHYHLRGGPSEAIVLEVHYRLLRDTKLLEPGKVTDWVWTHTDSIEGGYTVLNNEALILHLAAHTFLHHGEGELIFRQLFDIHRVIAQGNLDWDIIVGQAVAFRWVYATKRALTLCQEYFETPVPEGVLDELEARRSNEEDNRVARFKGSGHRWEQVSQLFKAYSWRDRLWMAFKIAVPASDYMRWRYDIPAGRAVWPYYLGRWRDQAGSMMAAIMKRLSDMLK